MRLRRARLSTAVATIVALLVGAVVVAPAQAVETRTISGTISWPADLSAEWQGRLSVAAQSTTGGGTVAIGSVSKTTGAYSLSVPAGVYDISFGVYGYEDANHVIQFSNIINEYYNDVKLTSNGATHVDVTTASKSNINATLEYGYSISGKVTVPAGVPAQWYRGVSVEAFGNGVNGVSGWVNPDGTYVIRGLIPGSYTLNALVRPYWNDAGTATVEVPLVGEYYVNSRTADKATRVTVNGNVTGKNFALDRAFTMSGTVSIPAGADTAQLKAIQVYATDGGEKYGYGTVDPATGKWTIKNLPPASYTVRFGASSTYWDDATATRKPANLITEYYNNSVTESGATKVTISTANRTGINATLALGGEITGGVILPPDAPQKWLHGVQVYAIPSSGDRILGTVDRTTGSYRIGQLPAGTYRVLFSVASMVSYNGETFSPAMASEYWSNARTLDTAKAVTVASGKTVTGIHAALEPIITDAPSPTVQWYEGTAGLKANIAAWTPAPTTRTFQWLRDGVAIPGATSDIYMLKDSDRGHLFAVRATGVLEGYADTVRTSSSYRIPELTFTTTPTPTVSGTGKAGYTLTAKPGTWAPSATLSYQWYRSGAKISGATKSTYTLTTSDRGKTITVKVTGKRTGYTSVTTTSAGKAIPKVFTTVTPRITGTPRSGHTLTVVRGSWTPTPSYTYQWFRNGVAITGATAKTYKLTSKDKGKKITARVYGKKSGYLTTYRTSAAKTIAK
ncbi:hypothetical protein [Demequina sp.]|uniref:hypothetical protein n=1 Tax=Demequina sp. TaxID=2050685 RepID=UPI003D0B9F2C